MGTSGAAFLRSGGGNRDRTGDLLHAMQALSQLSYTPDRGAKLYRTPLRARPQPTPADARIDADFLVGDHRGEIELAAHGLRAVVHLAGADHRELAGAADVEAVGAAALAAIGELAGARAGVEHAARVARILRGEALRLCDRADRLRHALHLRGDGELPVAGLGIGPGRDGEREQRENEQRPGHHGYLRDLLAPSRSQFSSRRWVSSISPPGATRNSP